MYHSLRERNRFSAYSASRLVGAPPSVVDETGRVGGRLGVSSCQFRKHFDIREKPHLEAVQGHSV